VTPPGDPVDPAQLVDALLADRFRVRRLVSDGANTAIYVADDEQHGRTVTLKVIRSDLAASPSFRAAFDEKMRSVAALSHPNIAAVYDWGMTRVGDTSTAYVVIEQLTGGSLRDLFDRGRRLTPSQALGVGLEACRALDYAHRRGFVHTELTPSKLVFGDDRRLRIVDFGLARLLGEPLWEQPDSVPTHVAWYASPEQGLRQPLDGTTDVYALCLALHEAVTGVLPFRDDSTVASLAARVGKLMPVSADLGPLAAVFERAGRPGADDRATAAEFGKELLNAASKLPRPEPLPLLSTGLFDTPDDQLRSPDDPTGGVHRPEDQGAAAPPPLVVVPLDEPDADDLVEAMADMGIVADVDATVAVDEPDVVAPQVGTEDLVILPLDTGIGADLQRAAHHEPTAQPAPEPFVPTAQATQVMPSVAAAPVVLRRRRGFPWKIVLSVIVLAALAVLGVLATQLFRTPVYRVPDLIGMPEAEAENLIATNGWEVSQERQRSDVVPVVGQVVRTAPQAGIDLAEGEPFLIVVSDGPTLRELPESTGVLFSEAQTRLIERGLDVEPVEQFDEVVPEGVVISWSVPGDPTLSAGSLVEPETLVQLVVSMGPAPRSIPDVVGFPFSDAGVEMDALGLVLTEAGQEFSDQVPPGLVISQSLEPGTEVARGDGMTVIVSKGPDLVIFPDISAAANFEEAAEILREAGFEAELIFGDAQGEVREYTIDGEVPEVGETFRRGTTVQFEAL
jgi:beta-lactam-binding protein with PASTA domain/serine/threonine protein kinase